jgi:hypothetical protein
MSGCRGALVGKFETAGFRILDISGRLESAERVVEAAAGGRIAGEEGDLDLGRLPEAEGGPACDRLQDPDLTRL